jgi:hypothetical protein
MRNAFGELNNLGFTVTAGLVPAFDVLDIE